MIRYLSLAWLLYWTVSVLPIRPIQEGLAPLWFWRFVSSMCDGGEVDWTALACCGLQLWAKMGLLGPSLHALHQ